MTAADEAIFVTVTSGILSVFISMFYPYIVRKEPFKISLLVGVVFLILFLTVLNRSPSERAFNFTPFWSYSRWNELVIRHEIMQNVIAFIPFGTCLRGLFQNLSRWWIVLICFAVSLLIELTQFTFALGFAEVDDVLHNSLGGLLGVMLYGKGCFLLRWLNEKWSMKKSNK